MTLCEKPKVSVVISTYNRPDMLHLVFLSYLKQSFRDFELIVADDGSGDETQNLIQQWSANSWFPIRHVWQEDRGFHKSEILNKAVLFSKGKTLIFSDQDCLVPRDFVKEHVSLLDHYDIIFGGRKWISRDNTNGILMEHRLDEKLIQKSAKMLCLMGIWEELMRFLFGRFGHYAVGANLAVRRDCFFAINGFNEKFKEYGCEDLELGYRLIRSGYRYAVTRKHNCVYHLWHPRNGHIPNFHKNGFKLAKNICFRNVAIRCPRGLSKNA